jgi:hypothetical protein
VSAHDTQLHRPTSLPVQGRKVRDRGVSHTGRQAGDAQPKYLDTDPVAAAMMLDCAQFNEPGEQSMHG